MSLTIPISEIVSESQDPLLNIHLSWERVELGAVATILNGFAFESKYFSKTRGMPLLRIRDVGNDRTECLYAGPFGTAYVVKAGDLVIGMDGDFKCGRWKGPDALLNQRVCKVQLLTLDFDPVFLEFALPGYLGAINEHTSSQTVRHLSSHSITEIPLPLPPLAEQKRIVAKTEELFKQVNAARDRLTEVPKILKRFRQAVLAAACSGRLTEDLRIKTTAVEPANELLLRIKEARLGSAETEKEHNEIITAFEEENLRLAEDELAFDEIPDSWIRCRVGAVGAVCNGSTPSRKRPEFWNGRISWVSSGEVKNNIITQTKERITSAGYESCSVRLLPVGTVLIAMIGEGKTRGQAAILDIKATINQNIACVRLEHGLVSPKYLWFWFQMQYEATRERGSGSGPQALNCQRVRELPFVLPPLQEQHEIVLRVEALFKLADAIGKRVQAATKRAEGLTHAILAKAFRGELVPTEAELARREGRTYEPAFALLERIRASRAER
jgi:type I restriction enzyme S subunit